jgi:hypothetical protein
MTSDAVLPSPRVWFVMQARDGLGDNIIKHSDWPDYHLSSSPSLSFENRNIMGEISSFAEGSTVVRSTGGHVTARLNKARYPIKTLFEVITPSRDSEGRRIPFLAYVQIQMDSTELCDRAALFCSENEVTFDDDLRDELDEAVNKAATYASRQDRAASAVQQLGSRANSMFARLRGSK